MEKVYTPEEIAQHLQVQERTVYGWLRSGKLKGAKLGRLWRIRASDYEAFLEASTIQAQRSDSEEEESTDSGVTSALNIGGGSDKIKRRQPKKS